MGLAFLNKKSWHTGSFKNIADVWLAQEKAKEQKRRREEIKKKLAEEKYSESLKKIQVEAGLLPESALNRMEWMHNMHDNLESKNNAEAYLLGKPVQSLENANHTFQEDELVNDSNEDFVRLQEDPLFQMQKEKERRKQELINNPVKMEHMIAEINALRKAKHKKKHRKDRSTSRSRTKEKRKDKKDKKSKRSGSSSSKSASRHRRSSSSRSVERKDKHKKKDKKKRDRSSDNSTSAGQQDGKVFSDYVKSRMGPLVEFDEDTYRFKFLARQKYKDNDPKKMTKEERDQMVQQMKKNAEEYDHAKLARYTQDTKADTDASKTGGFIQKVHQQAIDHSGKSGIAENVNRSRFFHDKNLAFSKDE